MSSWINTSRRSVLKSLAGSAGLFAAGFRHTAGADEPAGAEPPLQSSTAFLAPVAINRADVPTPNAIDVHAHFFNASDVPIRGYIEGPVANSMSSRWLAKVVRALAPIADGLGIFAITAWRELKDLHDMAARFRAFSPQRADQELNALQGDERKRISEEFYRLTLTPQGAEFREEYRQLMSDPSIAGRINGLPRIREIQADSVYNAMYATEAVTTEEQFREMDLVNADRFGEGVLAFVGYMMSARWSNLQTYKRAFSMSSGSIGVQHVLGALVDFDGWLDGKVRSPHEDQMELHALISRLSGGYMRPVMSYNPWTDAVSSGASLELLEAARGKGFVGAKIYPPNGFRPWGNAGRPPDRRRGPTGDQIEAALRSFWLKCRDWDLPVMAHAAPSMGRDNAHDLLSSPDNWKNLIGADFWTDQRGPRLDLGHFGGDDDHPEDPAGAGWPARFAAVMGEKRGDLTYADLGYWEGLLCRQENADCRNARRRLEAALEIPVGNGTARDRLMFGSDWLMLSKEKGWPAYARQLFKAIQTIDPAAVQGIFEGNARGLYTSL